MSKVEQPNPERAQSPASSFARTELVAFTCLLAILCGFIVGTPGRPFDKSFVVWFALVLASGVLLRQSAPLKIIKHIIPSAFPAALLSATIYCKMLVLPLLSAWDDTVSGSPVKEPDQNLLLLVAIAFAATTATIMLTSIAGNVIAEYFQRIVSLDSQAVTRVGTLIKAITGVVAAVFLLWAAVAS